MDKDRVKGSAQQAKGAVKEAAGKVTGDAKLQAEGKAFHVVLLALKCEGGSYASPRRTSALVALHVRLRAAA